MKKKDIVSVEIPEVVSEPRLVSYKMTATIRTGEYQNIIPEILIEGGTIEEARMILTNEVNTLRLQYDPSFKKVAPKTSVQSPTPKIPVTPSEPVSPVLPATPIVDSVTPVVEPKLQNIAEEENPVSLGIDGVQRSIPYIAAERVIMATKSMDALEMIENQIEKSVKLEEAEKDELLLKIIGIRKELYAKSHPEAI